MDFTPRRRLSQMDPALASEGANRDIDLGEISEIERDWLQNGLPLRPGQYMDGLAPDNFSDASTICLSDSESASSTHSDVIVQSKH